MRKDKLLGRGLEMEFRGGLEEEVTAHGGVGLLGEDRDLEALAGDLLPESTGGSEDGGGDPEEEGGPWVCGRPVGMRFLFK